MVEQFHEICVLLPEHLFEPDCDIWNPRQGVAAEEIGGGVMAPQYLLVTWGDHWGELLQVADHQQLHAAEGARVAAVFPQGVVDGIEQVGPDHRDFVDDQQVDGADQAQFLFGEAVGVACLGPGDVWGGGDLEE